MRTTRALGIVIVLQTVILVGQWLGGPVLPSAQAQPAFNPERDRLQMIEELKSVNNKLDRLIGILEGGNLQVRTTLPDDRNAGRPGAR
jgi:hypothetical protein